MGYRVRILPSGKELLTETGETVLDAALRQCIALPYGCRDGACGSCKGRILSGSITYGKNTPSAIDELDLGQGDALLCQAVPTSDLVLEAREFDALKGLAVRKVPGRVIHKQRLCHNVELLKLKLSASKPLQYLPGQYLNIVLKNGQRRGFSIANAPHQSDFVELHVRNVPGGEFTHYVFYEMKEKAILRLEGPLGSFFLREDSDRPIVLVAGGTGFAPLKAILEHAFFLGTQRQLHLFWGVRQRRDLYFHDLPEKWARERNNFRYTPVISEPAGDPEWTGETGLVTESVTRAYPDLSGHSLYMSGPPAMIREGKRCFERCGLPKHQLFFDAFVFAAGNHVSENC